VVRRASVVVDDNLGIAFIGASLLLPALGNGS
jgi:hypothetical protein